MPKTPESYQPSAEEMAKIQKERTMSDAELLHEGAVYIVGSDGGYRLEVNARQQTELHREMEQVFSRREEERLGKIRVEIRKELDELPIEELIQIYPELAEKIETIRLATEGREISLVRQKEAPELAIPVWSKSKHRGGTQGRILLNIPESRLSKGSIKMEFRSVCACCSSETYGLESPFRANHPKYPEYKKAEGEDDYTFKARHDREVKQYEAEKKKWDASKEAQKDKEWEEQKKQEYADAMRNAVMQNGIKYVAMRKRTRWAERYGQIEGVEFMEITEDDDVRAKINELRKQRGLEKEKVPSFEVSR